MMEGEGERIEEDGRRRGGWKLHDKNTASHDVT